MSYVYVDKKLIDMYKEHFDIYNPGKTIFDSIKIQTKVEIAIRWIWQGLESLPPELIPRIDWWLVEPHPRPEDLPLSMRYTTKHLLITLEFENELGCAQAEFRIYANGEIESKNFFEDNQGYSYNPPIFNLLDADVLVRENEWKCFNNYLIESLDLRIAYRED